jgi:membrane-bound serine protease (ClpP class)
MKRIIFYALSLTVLLTSLSFGNSSSETEKYLVKKVTYLEVNASINPATFNYLENNINKLSKDSGDLVIIKLDTPGGLVSTTKDILTLIGSSDFPIGVWITPEGASATSAGSIIASAAHILVMSEGTNIGAATPIGMGKDIEQKDSKAKAVNDLVSLVRSLSKARNRNPDKFEKMITKAESLDARSALKEKVIDRIINSEKELMQYIPNLVVTVKGKSLQLSTSGNITTITNEMDLGQRILNIFANPTTAYVLFIIGAALIYFEMQAPGGMISGSIGAICLVLAGIGFQVLPLNLGAMGLIILSFILFVIEAYVTSFGILTIAGLASLIFGSLFLFRTDNSLMDLERSVVYAVVGSVASYVLLIGYFLMKTYRKHKNLFSQNTHEGIVAKVFEHGEKYQVKVNGEIWNAIAKEELNVNDHIKVIEQDDENLILKIEKKNSNNL